MKINKGMIPPNGWHFKESDTLTITGDTYEILLDNIFKYRIRTGKPSEYIAREVDKYYCAKWPSACVMEAVDYGHAATSLDSGEAMSTRVARFAARMAGAQPSGGYSLVNQSIATERASICAKCPRNIPWKTGCNSCTASTAQLLLQLRKLRNTPSDVQLMACSLSGHENQTAVHLPDNVMKPDQETKDFLPPGCWKLTIL